MPARTVYAGLDAASDGASSKVTGVFEQWAKAVLIMKFRALLLIQLRTMRSCDSFVDALVIVLKLQSEAPAVVPTAGGCSSPGSS